jgi:hypothetical protein
MTLPLPTWAPSTRIVLLVTLPAVKLWSYNRDRLDWTAQGGELNTREISRIYANSERLKRNA